MNASDFGLKKVVQDRENAMKSLKTRRMEVKREKK